MTKVANMRRMKRTEGGYPCPLCASATAVIDSRPFENGVRRRRGCPACQHRFTTLESEGMLPTSTAAKIWRDVPVTMEFLAQLFDAYCGADGHNLVVSQASNAIKQKL